MCAQQKIAIVGRRIDSPLGVGSPTADNAKRFSAF